jgi:hypothetical protein
MGIDPAKMPTESVMETSLRERLSENKKLPSSKLSALAIVYDNQLRLGEARVKAEGIVRGLTLLLQ